MTLLAAAILYGLSLLIAFSLLIIHLQGSRPRQCRYGKPDCPCITSDATFFVHSAESRHGGASVSGAAKDMAELAKRPPHKGSGVAQP